MSLKVRASDAQLDLVGNATVSRYVRRDGPVGIGVGVASFGPLPEGTDPRTVWEAHDVPEIHYVLSGHGVLLEEDEEVPLGPGDVVITEAGIRHVLWGVGDEPLVAVYVASNR